MTRAYGLSCVCHLPLAPAAHSPQRAVLSTCCAYLGPSATNWVQENRQNRMPALLPSALLMTGLPHLRLSPSPGPCCLCTLGHGCFTGGNGCNQARFCARHTRTTVPPVRGCSGDMASCPNTPLVGVSRRLHRGTHIALESDSGDTVRAGGQEHGAVPGTSDRCGQSQEGGSARCRQPPLRLPCSLTAHLFASPLCALCIHPAFHLLSEAPFPLVLASPGTQVALRCLAAPPFPLAL